MPDPAANVNKWMSSRRSKDICKLLFCAIELPSDESITVVPRFERAN
jgi:hypothetical protein